MKNKLAKLIEILPWLSRHQGLSAKEVAKHFSITEKELLDLLQLAVFTGPGQAGGELVDIDFDDAENLFVIDAKGLERSIKFTPETAIQILAGLNYLMQLPGVVDTKALERLLIKLQNAFSLPINPFEFLSSNSTEQIVDLIGRAINSNSSVQIEYAGATSGDFTIRVIEPKSMVIDENIRYVKAWCQKSESVRLFRIERIKSITSLEFQQTNSDNLEFDERNKFKVTIGCTTLAALEFDVRQIIEKRDLGDNQHEIDLEVFSKNWIVREILSSNGEIWPIAPPELAIIINREISKWRSMNNII